MKIFNLETIRLILLQNGTSRNLGARLIGALSTSFQQRLTGRSREERAGETVPSKQHFMCHVLKLLGATFALLWPIHRVLGCNHLINKRNLLTTVLQVFLINRCNINCFYCSAFGNKQWPGSVCARQHENTVANLPLAAFSPNKQSNISPRKE